jgi:hypothetical protein
MVSVAAIFFVLGFLRLLLAASPEGKDTRSSLSIFKRGIYLKGVNTAYSKGALTFSELTSNSFYSQKAQAPDYQL